MAGLASDITRLAPAASTSAAQSFYARLAASSADVVTVIGHNDDGLLKFVDGSEVALSDLGQVGPLVALISCDAARYASGNAVGILPSEVTLTVAIEIERVLISRIEKLSSSPDVVGLKELLDESARSVLEPRPELWNYALVVAGGTVTVRVWQIHED